MAAPITPSSSATLTYDTVSLNGNLLTSFKSGTNSSITFNKDVTIYGYLVVGAGNAGAGGSTGQAIYSNNFNRSQGGAGGTVVIINPSTPLYIPSNTSVTITIGTGSTNGNFTGTLSSIVSSNGIINTTAPPGPIWDRHNVTGRDGTLWTVNNTYYGGGGGSGGRINTGYPTSNGFAGGLGGGGTGGSPNVNNFNGYPGGANTGGGGGGAARNGRSYGADGAGGSGIVIIYYKINNQLDATNKDENGLTYTLNSTNYTASVSDGTTLTSANILSYVVSNNYTYNVTSIGNNAFLNNTTLANVSIPSSVTGIGASAFQGCTGLTSITIPSSVINIGASAFQGCTGLTSITIPSSVINIGASAFSGCINLLYMSLPATVTNAVSSFLSTDASSIILPSSNNAANGITYTIANNQAIVSNYSAGANVLIPINVTTGNTKYPVTRIADGVFSGKSLTSVIIPPFITSIGNSAFKNNQLTTVNLPPGLTSIGTNCFENNLITSIYFPSGITTIPDSIFQNNRLVSINISPSLTTIGNYAFAYNYINRINNSTSPSFPNSLTSIGQYAFTSNQLSNITLPTNADFRTLNDGVFSYNLLQTIRVPNTITTVGIEVFRNNMLTAFDISLVAIPNSMFRENKLTTITIPSQITSIGYGAFTGCNATSITFASSNNLNRIDEIAFQSNQFQTITLPASITFIGNSAFSSGALTGLTIPSSVTTIDNAAFSRNRLISVSFESPCNISYLSPSVFADNSLNSITIPNTITSIGKYALNNNRLTFVSIPSSVTTIGNYAFANNLLRPIDVSMAEQTTITSIGYAAFYNNAAVTVTGTPIAIDSSGIKYSSFGQDTNSNYIARVSDLSGSSQSIIIPFTIAANNITYNVTSIANNAFSGKNLTSVILNMNINSIGQSAFANNNLTSITIPNTVTSLGDSAFNNNKLTSVTISTNVSSLNTGLFQLNRLTTITIPQSVNSLGGNVFADNSLNSITISSTITTISQHAFRNNRLTSIDLSNTFVNQIANNAFQNNIITQLSIPSRITSIGNSAFQNNRLSSVTFAGTSSMTTISDSVFADNSLNEITLPSGVTIIGNTAFQNNFFTSIQLPTNLIYIGQSAFQNNRLQLAINIPSTVNYIGDNAFAKNLLSNQVDTSYNGIITFLGQSVTTTLGANIFKDNNATTNRKVYITYRYGKSWASTTTNLTNQFIPSPSSFDSSTNNIQVIVQKATISPIVPSDQIKTYDGTIYLNTTYGATGLVNLSDNIIINGNVSFTDKNVGNNKPVIITLSLSGDASSNYTLDSTTITGFNASIIPKTIIPIITVTSKTYDTNVNANFTYNLSGVILPDNPILSGTSVFSDSSVGTNKSVNISGLSLSGDNSSNYTLSTTTVSSTATINKRFIYFTIPNKTYDGSSTIYKYDLSGLYSSDASNVILSGLISFAKATIGQDISVNTSNISLSGSKSANYDASYLRNPPYNSSLSLLTGNIIAKALDLSYVITKTYDATTAYNNLIDLSGIVPMDVSLVDFSYTVFANYDVSAVTASTIRITNVYLKGTKSANYSINQTIDVSGRILPKQLDVSGTIVKIYDGTVNTYNNRIDLSGIFPVDNGQVNVSYTNATYNDVNIGTTIPVTIRDLSLNGLKSQNYAILSNITIPGIINKKVIDISASAIQKVYDGTTDINCIIDLSGLVIGDSVYATVSNSNVSSPNFGTYTSVIFSNFMLNGTKASNYDIINTNVVTLNVAASIRRKFLPSTANVVSKSYDGTTSATVTFILSGVLSTDTVDVSNNYIANYNNANAGQSKTVEVSNITLYGISATNYDVSSTRVLSGNISPRVVDASCAPISKTYDGTTTASSFSLYLIGVIGTQSISLNHTSATFNNPFAGTNRSVNISGISINNSSNNYILSSTTLSVPGGTIFRRNVQTNITGTSKTYDNTNIANVILSLTNKIQTDNLNITYTQAVFDTPRAGQNKSITISGIVLSGFDLDNYSLPANSITITTGSILPYILSSSNITGSVTTKYYDPNYYEDNDRYDASASIQLYLQNIISSDQNNLSLIYSDAYFINPDKPEIYDNSKNLTVRATGLDLSGSAKYDYSLNITSFDLSGSFYSITPIRLDISLNNPIISKIYDGNTNIDVSLAVYDSSKNKPNNVFINYTTSNFNNKNVGTNKSIQVNGIILTGIESYKYKTDSSLSTLTGSISKKRVDISRNIITKTYDGNKNLTNILLDLSGVITGDAITCRGINGIFDSSAVGTKNINITNISLIGDLSMNYDLPLTTIDLSGQITAKLLTVSASKIYDSSNTVYQSDLSLSGIVQNEIVSVNASGEYSDISPGNILANIRNISLFGENSLNYTLPLSINNISATIYKKQLGLIVSKVYDGSKNIISTNVSLNGVLNNENVNFNGTGNFADASAGNNIPVTFITSSLIGNSNHTKNYSIDDSVNSANLTGTISRKPITVSIPDVIYNRTNIADISDNSIRNSLINIDRNLTRVRLSNPSNTIFYYDSSQAGQRTILNASGNLFITGDLSKNYILDNTQIISGNINRKQITLSVSNKIYNGSTNLDMSNVSLINVLPGDQLSLSAELFLDISNVGLGNAYINNTSLNGIPYNNYFINLNNKLVITILPRPITVEVNRRVYDGTSTVYNADLYLNNTIQGDNVTVTATGNYSNIYVGTNKTVTLSNIQLSGTSRTNYSTDSSAIKSGEIYRRTAGLSILPRIYDGTTNIYLSDFSLNNIVSIDISDVSINGTGYYNEKNAGTRIAYLSDLSLTGSSAISNYDISATKQVSAVITQLPVILSILPKVYDTSAGVNINFVFVKNKITNDIVNVFGNGLYDSSFVGTRSVTLNNLSLYEVDSANYYVPQSMTFSGGIITPHPLSIVVNDKIYDGTNIISSEYLSLSKIYTNDIGVYPVDASRVYVNGYLPYINSLAEMNKIVDISNNLKNVYLIGDSSINYYIYNSIFDSGNILQKQIDIIPISLSKTYDTFTDAYVELDISGLITNDTGKYFANYEYSNYDDPMVGNAKNITVRYIYITGPYVQNYTYATYLTLSGDINPTMLTVNANIQSKIYDNNNSAIATYSLNGILQRDNVRVTGDASFNNKNAGINKTVTMTNFVLNGSSSSNYYLDPSLIIYGTANIYPSKLIPSIRTISNKTYDNSLNTTGIIDLSGVISNNQVSATGRFSFRTSDVENNKPVDVSNIYLIGSDASNYELSFNYLSGISSIVPLQLTIVPYTKSYDGTVNVDNSNIQFTGMLTDESIAFGGSAVFDSPFVGARNILINGGYLIGSNNYIIQSNQTIPSIITKRNLTLVIEDKIYDRTPNVDISSVTLSGIQNNDNISISSIAAIYTNNGNVANNININISSFDLSGDLSSQYDISGTNIIFGNIIPKTLTVSTSASNKLYDGLLYTEANVVITSGIIPGDNVYIISFNANFVTPDIGDNKQVVINNIQLGGSSANNYIILPTTTTASVLFNPKIKYCAPSSTSASQASCIVPDYTTTQSNQTNPNTSSRMKYAIYTTKNSYNS